MSGISSAGPFVVNIDGERKEYLYLSTARAAITRHIRGMQANGFQWQASRSTVSTRYLFERYTGPDTQPVLAETVTQRVTLYRVEDGLLRYYSHTK